MPTISHLDGVRDRPGRDLTVSAATIARDNLDSRMLGKPSLHGGGFPVRQQRHDPPSLQVTYDCAVTVVPPESPVIDTYNDQRIRWHHGSSSHDPQQGVITDGQHESLGKACCRSSAECQSQMMDNALQPRRTAPRIGTTSSPNRSAKICRRQWSPAKIIGSESDPNLTPIGAQPLEADRGSNGVPIHKLDLIVWNDSPLGR